MPEHFPYPLVTRQYHARGDGAQLDGPFSPPADVETVRYIWTKPRAQLMNLLAPWEDNNPSIDSNRLTPRAPHCQKQRLARESVLTCVINVAP